MLKRKDYFYEAFIYYQYFNTQNNRKQEETEYLINIDWITKWKKFNYSNLKDKYFSKYRIKSQEEYNKILYQANNNIQYINGPGMINNMDIIENFDSFLNDGNINDYFNFVVDISKKKYSKIPQTLFKLLVKNYDIDYTLPAYYSEQQNYKIYFFDEKDNKLDEGKIYFNKNNILNIGKRLINIINAGKLNIKKKNIKEEDLKIQIKKFNIIVTMKGGKKENNKNIENEKILISINSPELSINSDKSQNSSSIEFSSKNSKKMDKSVSTTSVLKKNDFMKNNSEIKNPNYLIKINKKGKHHYPKGIIGLMNLGNTCYMNCVIQVLSNIKELREYFLNEKFKNDLYIKSYYNGEIAKQFYSLLKNIWNNSNNSEETINPNKFKTIFGKFNPEFNDTQSHDAVEFLMVLLNCLQEDLFKGQKLPKPLDQYENTKDVRWKLYKIINESIIFDLFYGMEKNETNCLNLNCLFNKFNFQIFNVLNLPLHGPEFSLNKNELKNYHFFYINCYIVLYPFNSKCVCIKFPIERNLFTSIINDEIIQFIMKITYIDNFEVRFDDLDDNKNVINELVKSDFLWKKKNINEEINIYFYANNNLSSYNLFNNLTNNKENIKNYFHLEYLKKKKKITKNDNLNNQNEKKNNESSFFYITNFVIQTDQSIKRIGTQQRIKFNEKNNLINLYQEICKVFKINYDYQKEKMSLNTFNILKDPKLNKNLNKYNVIDDIKKNYENIKIPFIISIRINDFDNDINIPIPYNSKKSLEEFKSYLKNELELYTKDISKLSLDIFYIEKNYENITKLNNIENCYEFNFLEENQLKKSINPQSSKMKSNNFTLKHLFNFYQISELFLNKNIICECCLQEVYSKTSFVKIPKILFLHLKRTENGKIKKNFIDFEFSITAKNYFHGLSEDIKNIQYNLISIIYFYGNTPNDGHYNCVCKNIIDNKWYKFNDNEIYLMDENDLKNENVYILIYQQQN